MIEKREDVKPIMDMARTHENCAQTCKFVIFKGVHEGSRKGWIYDGSVGMKSDAIHPR